MLPHKCLVPNDLTLSTTEGGIGLIGLAIGCAVLFLGFSLLLLFAASESSLV